MSKSRLYWESGSFNNSILGISKDLKIKPYCILYSSFSRLGFKKNVINRYIYIYFSKDWLNCLKNFDILLYYKFLNMVNKFMADFRHIKIYTSLTNIVDLRNSHIFFWYDYNYYQYKKVLSYLNNSYIIHFIRLQKRYNKRRYLRVRVVSRPSFWAGSLLSCICIGMFWGASLHSIDWACINALIVDINIIIVIIYFIIICRYYYIVLDCYTKSLRLKWKRTYSKFLIINQHLFSRIKWFK